MKTFLVRTAYIITSTDRCWCSSWTTHRGASAAG